MKLVRISQGGSAIWGEVREDRVFTLAQPPFESLCYDGNSLSLKQCKLLAPCQATKIICVGKNYAEHVRELGGEPPDHPILFMKGVNTLNTHEGEIHAPSFVERLDYEGELAVVIKRRAKDLKQEEALDYILGYTCLNDVTARDVQRYDGQWTRAKSMDGFCPIGPWLVTGVDPADLKVETRLNGQVRQSARTSMFLHSLPKLLSYITQSMTLEPGDVVATGTPAGIGPMLPGDEVEVEIEGIGVLRNYIT